MKKDDDHVASGTAAARDKRPSVIDTAVAPASSRTSIGRTEVSMSTVSSITGIGGDESTVGTATSARSVSVPGTEGGGGVTNNPDKPSSWSHSSGAETSFSKRGSGDAMSEEFQQRCLKPAKFHASQRKSQDALSANKLRFSSLGLIGRDEEKKILLKRLDRVLTADDGDSHQEGEAARGRRELVLISGYSGAGKTTLASALMKPVKRRNGLYARGKFDLYLRDEPYAGISAACREICGRILSLRDQTSPSDRQSFENIRDELIEKLGSENILILANVIPELTDVFVGDEKISVEDAKNQGAAEAKDRFDQTFRIFMRVVARVFAPLVIEIDDLQWSDAATLEMIELLITDRDNPSLMVIGIFRSNEIDDAHLLSRLIRDLRHKANQDEFKDDFNITEITIGSLITSQTNQILMHLLSIDDPTITHRLADVCQKRCQGNVFSLLVFVETIVGEEGGRHGINLEGGEDGGLKNQANDVSIAGPKPVKSSKAASIPYKNVLDSVDSKAHDRALPLFKAFRAEFLVGKSSESSIFRGTPAQNDFDALSKFHSANDFPTFSACIALKERIRQIEEEFPGLVMKNIISELLASACSNTEKIIATALHALPLDGTPILGNALKGDAGHGKASYASKEDGEGHRSNAPRGIARVHTDQNAYTKSSTNNAKFTSQLKPQEKSSIVSTHLTDGRDDFVSLVLALVVAGVAAVIFVFCGDITKAARSTTKAAPSETAEIIAHGRRSKSTPDGSNSTISSAFWQKRWKMMGLPLLIIACIGAGGGSVVKASDTDRVAFVEPASSLPDQSTTSTGVRGALAESIGSVDRAAGALIQRYVAVKDAKDGKQTKLGAMLEVKAKEAIRETKSLRDEDGHSITLPFSSDDTTHLLTSKIVDTTQVEPTPTCNAELDNSFLTCVSAAIKGVVDVVANNACNRGAIGAACLEFFPKAIDWATPSKGDDSSNEATPSEDDDVLNALFELYFLLLFVISAFAILSCIVHSTSDPRLPERAVPNFRRMTIIRLIVFALLGSAGVASLAPNDDAARDEIDNIVANAETNPTLPPSSRSDMEVSPPSNNIQPLPDGAANTFVPPFGGTGDEVDKEVESGLGSDLEGDETTKGATERTEKAVQESSNDITGSIRGFIQRLSKPDAKPADLALESKALLEYTVDVIDSLSRLSEGDRSVIPMLTSLATNADSLEAVASAVGEEDFSVSVPNAHDLEQALSVVNPIDMAGFMEPINIMQDLIPSLRDAIASLPDAAATLRRLEQLDLKEDLNAVNRQTSNVFFSPSGDDATNVGTEILAFFAVLEGIVAAMDTIVREIQLLQINRLGLGDDRGRSHVLGVLEHILHLHTLTVHGLGFLDRSPVEHSAHASILPFLLYAFLSGNDRDITDLSMSSVDKTFSSALLVILAADGISKDKDATVLPISSGLVSSKSLPAACSKDTPAGMVGPLLLIKEDVPAGTFRHSIEATPFQQS